MFEFLNDSEIFGNISIVFCLHFQVLPFAHDLCLEFGSHYDSAHKKSCKKRHFFVREDEPELCDNSLFFIKFQIMHFYSPVHYKAKIFAQSEGKGEWLYLRSQSKIIEIYLPKIAKRDLHEYQEKLLQQIFNRMNDASEPCFEAKVYLKLKNIFIIHDILRFQPDRVSFKHDLYSHYVYSDKIMNRLREMASPFKREKNKNATLQNVTHLSTDDEEW